jgi:hypothetical protein
MSIHIEREPAKTPITRVITRLNTTGEKRLDLTPSRRGVVMHSYGEYGTSFMTHRLTPGTARQLGEALIEMADQAEVR